MFGRLAPVVILLVILGHEAPDSAVKENMVSNKNTCTMLSRVLNDEECDASKDASSNKLAK